MSTQNEQENPAMAKTIELNVTGMTCDHCVRSVTNALKDVPGVSEAVVSLDEKKATVTGDEVDVAKLIAAVEEEGYEATIR
jgi:copper chaperone CopZ